MNQRRLTLAVISFIAAASAHAAEQHTHAAHVHGIGQLNIALEGKQLSLELISPTANIVGFEHSPGNDQEHAAQSKSVARLKDAAALFAFDAGAKCVLSSAEVSNTLSEAPSVPAEGEEEDGQEHMDLNLSASFSCAQPQLLKAIGVKVFSTFPLTSTLNVAFVGERGQSAAKLSATASVFTLPK